MVIDIILSPLQEDILQLLRDQGAMQFKEILTKISKPVTTVKDNLDKLIKFELVQKIPCPKNERGRPKMLYRVKNEIKK